MKKKESKSEKEPTWDEIGEAIGKKMEQGCCKDSIQNKMKKHIHHHCGGNGAFYGLGFIGALVYYLSTATSFWTGVLGILKAIVWPAFFVYEALKFLGM